MELRFGNELKKKNGFPIDFLNNNNISSLLQSSMDVQRDLCLNWSRIPKTIFYGLVIYVMGKIKGAYIFSFYLNSISL